MKLFIGILALCICGVFARPSIAQTQEQGQAAAGAGAEKAEKVAQVLNLSPQQKSQLEPILQAEGPKVKAIIGDPNLTPEQKKAKLKSVHAQTDPLVKSILNPTQYKQWQTIRNDELQQMK